LPDVERELRQIRYFPAAVVLARYSRPAFTDDVRALVLPADSPLSNVGAYGRTRLDVARWTFSGRAARPLLEPGLDAEAMLADAERRVAPFLPLDPGTRGPWAVRSWEHALCGYSRHHAGRLERIERGTAAVAGLALTGDWWRGVSLEGCFRGAVDRVSSLERSGALA